MLENDLMITSFYLHADMSRYCIKTGKVLEAIPIKEIKKLVRVHGVERAGIVIAQLKQSVAIEWILTDSLALSKLAIEQPVEYLIYALSALCIKPKQDNTLAVLKDFNVKIEINKFLKRDIDVELVLNIAELTRRILANHRPTAMQVVFDNMSLSTICASFNSLVKYQLTLQECLKQIALGYYDDQLVNDRKRQKKMLFAQQKRLTALTGLELDIGLTLNDFDVILEEDTELVKLVKSTKKYKLDSKLKDKELKRVAKEQNLDRKTVSLDSFKKVEFKGISFVSLNKDKNRSDV